MSGSATTTADGNTDDPPPPADTSAGEDDPPPPATTDDGECPYGTEGCLCDVGATCDEGLECIEGTCVAPPACPQLDVDPRADEDSATMVDEVTCGNGNDLGVVGTLAGPDTDWYTFLGNEVMFCPEQPAATAAADVTVQVCVFIECVEGDADNVSCADESSAADSSGGRPGCCGDNQAQVANYDCGMFQPRNVNAWVSVGTTEEVCVDYALSYAI